MLLDENDYDTEEEKENYIEYTSDIIAEIQYDNRINIIKFYKELLLKSPEFIGINNISSGEILNIIECVYNNYNNEVSYLLRKDYRINEEQLNIFDNMFKDLRLKQNENIYNIVTKRLFNRMYVI